MLQSSGLLGGPNNKFIGSLFLTRTVHTVVSSPGSPSYNLLHSSKRIVVREQDENDKKDVGVIDNYDVYLRTMLRHEILHAFLFESGLHNNFSHPEWGHDETMIDWVAVQFPKILEAFKQVDCL